MNFLDPLWADIISCVEAEWQAGDSCQDLDPFSERLHLFLSPLLAPSLWSGTFLSAVLGDKRVSTLCQSHFLKTLDIGNALGKDLNSKISDFGTLNNHAPKLSLNC